MSEQNYQYDKEGCFIFALVMIVILLVFYVVVDMYAGHRDMHYIRDLQRRIAVLESEVRR